MEKLKLGDITTYKKGYAFSSRDYKDEGIQVVRVSDFTMDSISTENAVYISPDEKYNDYILKEGDILIQTVGSWANNPNSVVGKVVRVPKECEGAYLNQNIVKIVPKGIEDNYLYYALKANKFTSYCVIRGQGAANQASITLDTIFRFKFGAIEASCRSEVSSFLNDYDRLIANNTKRIQLLEQMAENLYKEWFVRFRFPGHKNVEFENGLPKGWSSERLFDVAEITYGYSFSSEDFCDDSSLNPVVRIRDIPNNATKTYTPENCDGKYRIKENSILVGMDGIFHMCIWSGGTAYLNQRVVQIDSKSESLCNYLLYFSVYPQVKFWEQTLTGTTVTHLGDKHLKKMRVIIPESSVLKRANELMNNIMNEISSLRKSNRNLVKQRDLLLPRLMCIR